MARYKETRRAASGGNQPALNKARVEAIPVPLPPIHQQAAVVAGIESLLSVVDRLLGTIAMVRRRSFAVRSAVLRDAFS